MKTHGRSLTSQRQIHNKCCSITEDFGWSRKRLRLRNVGAYSSILNNLFLNYR